MSQERDPVKDLARIPICVAIAVGIAAYLVYSLATMRQPSSLIMEALVQPTVVVATVVFVVLNLLSGILVIATRARWAVYCSIVTAIVAAISYLVAFHVARGGSLVALVVCGYPALMIERGRKALAGIEETNSQQGVGD
jgi:hypothetical protein